MAINGNSSPFDPARFPIDGENEGYERKESGQTNVKEEVETHGQEAVKGDAPILELTNAEPMTVSVELFFDGYEKKPAEFAPAEQQSLQATSSVSKVDPAILALIAGRLKA